jgi:hypothetical protein
MKSESSESCGSCVTRTLAYTAAIAGSFLAVAGIVWLVRQYNPPVAVDQARAGQRAKALKELTEANATALSGYAWQDQAKGIVRLPVAEALKLTEQEWQNPAQARAKLIANLEKANAKPPPPPPSQFE